ncbi:MAG: SOS response-associated peptidase [Polyangiales bacterium]
MCGRFFQDLEENEVRAHFDVPPGEAQEPLPLPSRYNVGPGQHIWVVRHHPQKHARSLDALHWGLIPHFAKDRKGAFRLINARAETLDRAPTFRVAFAKRRCLVAARGFYEWQARGKHKQPFAIAPDDGGLLAFAGIWENWKDPATGEWVRSVAIVTTDAAPGLDALHHRMPVIVAPCDHARWLGEAPADADALKALLRPYAEPLRVWPVSTRVNRAAVDGPENLAPVALAAAEQAPEGDAGGAAERRR